MIQAILKGFESSTSRITNIFLSEKQIGYCKGCHSCWFKTPGKCVIKDDMEKIIQQLLESDIVILGSPLYFNNISGTLKVFFDRLTSIGGNPHKNENIKGNKKTTSFIMVSNCGFPHRSQFDVISLWINNVVKMLQVDLIGEFYATNGKILTQPEDDQITRRKNYLEYLTNCGKELLKNGKLSDKLRELSKKEILEF